MSDDLNSVALGLTAFCLLPLALWVEALWNGARGFRILVTVLLIWWLAIIAVLTIPGMICEGSVVKGLMRCDGLLSATSYNRAMVITPGLFIVPLIYVCAVIYRLFSRRAK